MINKTMVEDALKVYTAVSSEMEQAITLWAAMYRDAPPWKKDTVQTLNTPAVIATKVAKMATIEAECTVTGSARADYIAAQLAPVWLNIRNVAEVAVAKGGLIFKPYIDGGDVVVDRVHADRFFPTAFDSNVEVTGAIFVAQQVVGKVIYTRLERHEYADGT